MTNETLQSINRLRAYAATCRTAVINEDAMTALELAGCTAAKVNEVVDLVNDMLTIVLEVATKLDIIPNTYDESAETLKL